MELLSREQTSSLLSMLAVAGDANNNNSEQTIENKPNFPFPFFGKHQNFMKNVQYACINCHHKTINRHKRLVRFCYVCCCCKMLNYDITSYNSHTIHNHNQLILHRLVSSAVMLSTSRRDTKPLRRGKTHHSSPLIFLPLSTIRRC
jgi:hypothetical protein